ncbi:MAG: hypothetical protein A3F09_04435 [Chlamydiae bacterium RIFCSPHIGHO2_12_FULL_49_11]|nr:MAG: hypothetical protein A3F09_04435 [Chlamydiae bacterium RIFCSPHIGHO2_12_FULL_49_11]
MVALKIESFALSDQGLVRATNEDAFAKMQEEGIFILADGLGGHNAGEIAASSAVEYMLREIQTLRLFQKQNIDLSDQSVLDFLDTSMQNTNLWIYQLSISNPYLHGMGTTLSLLYRHNDKLYLAHIGDSRIYRFRKEYLALLTEDHVHDMTGQGPGKKVLSQAIGTSLKVRPQTQKITYMHDDIFLLCSDGLSDLVSEEEILRLMDTSAALDTIAQNLIASAKKSGGYDNITLMLIRIVA